MKCLGVNVYHWGARQQDRLLVECIGPLVDELSQERLIERFWFDRFDARGPHVLVLMTLVEDAGDRVVARLESRLDRYLAERPSTEILPPEVLARLHAETRGKSLCAEDARPGVARNNSYALIEHDPQGYPFALMPGETGFWLLVGDLARWTIQQIAAAERSSSLVAAVRLAVGVDEALAKVDGAQVYWRFHATTLLPYLEERLAADEDEVLASLSDLIGERNRNLLARLWADSLATDRGWPYLPRLVAFTLPASRPLLREVLHCAWKQLGLPVRSHLALVLFAWLCQRAPAPVRSM